MQIAQQGSNRVYTRETDANGKTYIRVTGTNRDENRAFIYMARHFHALGLPVPELYSVSEDEMSYTQEDLGDTLLFDHLEPTLLERAIRALAHIQVTGAKDFNWSVCFPVPAMDERSIRWDLNYFKYCFLKGTKLEFSEPKLEDDFDSLVKFILAHPAETFLYRDFQSRNVMVRDGQPYFIDFQGGRRGPPRRRTDHRGLPYQRRRPGRSAGGFRGWPARHRRDRGLLVLSGGVLRRECYRCFCYP